jgi:uncharacterized protein
MNMRSMLLTSFFLACGLAANGHCQDLASLEKMLLFFPAAELLGTPAKIGLKFDEVSLQTADQVKLHAWWVPREHAIATLILSHGNAGNISYRLDKVKIFHDLGLNVLLYDYRGYGKSEGAPSEEGLYADVQAAYDFVAKEKKIPSREIIAYGESLGGAIAAHLASKNEVGAMILDSSFSSLQDMARKHYPLLAGLVQSHFDTFTDTKAVKSPVLVLHSSGDEIAPYAQGKRLFEAAKEPKQFVELRGDHNNAYLTSKRAYMKGFDSFLKAHFSSVTP